MFGRSLFGFLALIVPLNADAAVYRYDYVGSVTEAIYDDAYDPSQPGDRTSLPPNMVSGPRTGFINATFTLDEAELGASLGSELSRTDTTEEEAAGVTYLAWTASWSDELGSSESGWWRIGGGDWINVYGYWMLDLEFRPSKKLSDVLFGSYEDGWGMTIRNGDAEYCLNLDVFADSGLSECTATVLAEGSWTRTVVEGRPYFTPIPLPAGLPLLAAGLGALGLLRWRAAAR